jgi:ketosteroid isomerase-like protein
MLTSHQEVRMNTDDQQEILTQEDRLTEATRAFDLQTLDRLYADTLVFTGVTGVVCDKRAVINEARRGAVERQAATTSGVAAVVAYDKDDVTTVRHGDTAVTSFRFGVTIRAGDQDVTRRYRTTNVWMKQADRWQVIAAHTAALG